jgi:hypothetical protein
MRRRSCHLTLVFLLAVAQGACTSGAGDTGGTPPPASPPPAPPPPPPSPAPVASVSVTGNSGLLVPLQTLQFAATTRDAAGNLLTDRTITWQSSAPVIASVSGSGLVAAVGPGSATISASSEGQSGSATVVVQSGLFVGPAGAQLTALAGHLQLIIPAGALSASIALTAVANGAPPPVTGLVSGTAVDIGPASTQFGTPATLQLGYDASAVAAGAQPAQFRLEHLGGSTWTLIAGSTVDVNSRTVTGPITTGGSYAIVEIPAPVATVAVTAATTTLNIGDSPQLTAVPRDAQGNTLTNRVVSWLSTAPAVATVTASGAVTAVAAGTTTIRATSEGVSGEIVLTVLSPSTVLEQHALAQEGFAIALSSTVLQSQFEVLIATVNPSDPEWLSCSVAHDRSSFQRLSSGNTVPFDVTIFYDEACARPYMVEHVTVLTLDTVAQTTHLVATAVYKGPTGTTLGATVFDQTSYATPGVLTVAGQGVFTPADGTPAAHLGLNCVTTENSNTLPCQGGIVQNFAALNRALGSVTPLTLQLAATADANGNTPLTFGGGSTLLSGALNSLTLSSVSPTALVISGGTSFATTIATGRAETYSLFPPTPTGWTVTDAGNDLRFAINVVSSTARNSAATITRISTGVTLATANLDQSGTGTITYSDGTSSSVTSWVIAQ